jgi:DNA-binding GntR family transcriptional regulator
MQLMEEIGASRTPIREALNKLEQEKLVRIVSKKGIMVSELTLKEINDVYQVRLMFEPQLVRIWGPSIPVGVLEECRSKLLLYNVDMDITERNQLDDLLHRTVIDYCQNTYLREWMYLLCNQNQRIRMMTSQLDRWMEQNNKDHLLMIEKLLRGECDLAAEYMKNHLETAKKNTFDCLLKPGL